MSLFKKSEKEFKVHKPIKPFNIVIGIFFIFVCLITLIPIWKVLVDSFDLRTAYGMKLIPEVFGLDGYISVFTNPTLYRPLLISFFTTLVGSFVGLALSTLGAYVLIQEKMPGRGLLSAMLLFTIIFNGGMIPTYLVLEKMNLVDTLHLAILLPGLNVFNLILMKNFFDNIPKSLFESAAIDGCSPIGIFFKIVLPLSKAALAAIGLMFAVAYWNDYITYKIYIRNSDIFNFQMKLRSVMMGSDLPSATGSATENTVRNAATIIAILPFVILYPFAQKYFITGINVGAVKE